MKRVAFKMYLKPGFSEEYRKRHARSAQLKASYRKTEVEDFHFLDKETNVLLQYRRTMENNPPRRSAPTRSCRDGGTSWRILWR